MNAVEKEIAEVQRLLEIATFPTVRSLLTERLNTLQASAATATATATATAADDESTPEVAAVNATSTAPTTAATTAATTPHAAPAPTSAPARLTTDKTAQYIPISSFAWDQGSFSSPSITVYVDLDGVGSVIDKENNIKCHFTKDSLDLTVKNHNGKNYRLVQTNLFKDIIPEKCNYTIKKNKIVIKLMKAPSSLGGGMGGDHYDNWTSLTTKKTREQRAAEEAKKNDPSAHLQSMLKDMYEEGDDKMRAIIGEAMTKQGRGMP